MKLKIAILAGGNSSEAGVSRLSAEHIASVIDRELYDPYLIMVEGTRWFHEAGGKRYDIDKNDFSLTIGGNRITPGYALILIHGTPGEDGLLQAYFNMMGIPCSTGGFVSSVVTFDKNLCKRALAGSGIPMARDLFINKGDAIDCNAIVAELGLPLFVKPNASGSSFGVSKVKSADELPAAIEEAMREGDQALIEEFVGGTEVGCGIMITPEKEYIFPVTEIVSKNEFFDYEAKYTGGKSDEITPARIDGKTTSLLADYTRRIYKTLNCRGIVRIDFIVREGVPHLIEVNSVPGMSKASIVPKQAECMGLSMKELFTIIIENTK